MSDEPDSNGGADEGEGEKSFRERVEEIRENAPKKVKARENRRRVRSVAAVAAPAEWAGIRSPR